MGSDGLVYSDEKELQLSSCCWDYGRVDRVRVSGPHQARLVRPAHTLIVYDGYHSADGNTTINGDVWFDQKRTPATRVIGQVADIIPSGCDFDAISYAEGTLSYTAISISPRLIEQMPGGKAGLIIEPGANLRNPLLKQLCLGLQESDSELHASSLMMAMLAEAARYQHAATPDGLHRETLSRPVRERLASYIEDSLGENITLQAMAQIAELSIFHFSRAFRQHFGLPPYQYVLSRRLERARQQVTQTTLTLTAIALQCGFSSPGQFSTQFRRYFGLTPSAMRLTLAR
ncbi:helix-turn-helix domain-containing protein [Serratia quinivorans]|uniref:helix-turn-helix domain-containing protein n=1 Tax=Serratia quinivorans TaxID=137545 RepID=UPI00217867F5|nr:AraC family transcriptional regulator [Serratia quinivorans]CAI1871988.1 L-rhamnose operon regulatory protein rhaS [Serratia quinivorans]CAI1972835.1 L-rhamnose operon regulatory protein rhaS [Serratia quinivorans]